MTTPAISARGPERGRAALSMALGAVVPTATVLVDGRIRLTEAGDVLDRAATARLTERADRLAGQRIDDERLIAELAAGLGAEIHHARGGSDPRSGSVEALDRLLAVPGLSESFQATTRSVLRDVLESGRGSDPLLQRLAAERAAQRRLAAPPVVEETVAAAGDLRRSAELINRRNPPAPAPARSPGPGRHRRDPRAPQRRLRGPESVPTPETPDLTAPPRPTAQVSAEALANGPTQPLPRPLTEATVLDALGQLGPTDLAGRLTAVPRLIARPRLGIADLAGHGPQHFRVHIGEPPRGLVAETTLRAGTEGDPHVLTVSPRANPGRLARIWANQLSRGAAQLDARAAGRPGLATRLRSAMAPRRTDQERAATAWYDEFRHLSRIWREAADNQRTDRSPAEVATELTVLATTMGRNGVPVPSMPWVATTPQTVPAPQPEPPPAPGSLEALRLQTTALRTSLERAAAEQRERAEGHRQQADTDREKAAEAIGEAEKAEARFDDARHEEARKLRKSAKSRLSSSEQHDVTADLCYTAAVRAGDALAAADQLLNHIDDLTTANQAPGAELTRLAEAVETSVHTYHTADTLTRPPADAKSAMMLSGRLPHLSRLARDINAALAGTGHTVTPNLLQEVMKEEPRRLLAPSGLVLTFDSDARTDASRIVQLRIKLDPGQLNEVLGHPIDFDESQVIQLEQGGYDIVTQASQVLTGKAPVNLAPAVAALPDGPYKAAAMMATPSFEHAFAQTRNATVVSRQIGVSGSSAINRGRIQRFRTENPRYRVSYRRSAVAPWSDERIIDSGEPYDAATLDVGVGHSYTVPPPTDLITVDQAGRPGERTRNLPEHTALRVDNLDHLCDRGAVELRNRLGSLDRVGYDNLRQLCTEDLPSRLDEAVRAGGVGRMITNGGRPVAFAQIQSRLVLETVELVTGSSDDEQNERLRIDQTLASGGEGFGASQSTSGGVGYGGLTDLGDSTLDLGPSVRAGRSTGRNDSLSTGDMAIRPSVQRTRPTYAVKARMVHLLTVTKVGTDEQFSIPIGGDAVLRMPENEAFRYGLPVPREALVLDDEGRPRLGNDGRTLLRGDPQPTPPDVTIKPPSYIGNGPGKLRGAGPALVQDFRGIDPVLKEFLRKLSREGLIPPIDRSGTVVLAALEGDNQLKVASQLANLERVNQQLTNHRAETAYDSGCQKSWRIVLDEHRPNLPRRQRTFRVDLDQDLDNAMFLGLKPTETNVDVGIASNTTGRGSSRSRSIPLLARLGLSDRPGRGQAGDTPEVGGNYGRTVRGRSSSWSTGQTSNVGSIVESGAPPAVFDTPGTMTILEETARGDSTAWAHGDFWAQISWDSEFCDLGKPPHRSVDGPVDPQLLDTAKLQHIDIGDPLSRLAAVAPELADPSSTARQKLAGFLNVRNLVVRPELLGYEYQTPLVSAAPSNPLKAYDQRNVAPQLGSVTIRTKIKNLTYLTSGHAVVGDVGLRFTSSSRTAGVSSSGSKGISGGTGTVEQDGSGSGGSANLSTSYSTSADRSETTITGNERVGIKLGQHYQFKADLETAARIQRRAGGPVQEVPLDDGVVVMLIPERDALRLYARGELSLPVEKVADVVERIDNGALGIDRRIAAGVIRAYHRDKAGHTEGLPGRHTDDRVRALLDRVSGRESPPAEPISETLDTAQQLVSQRVEVQLPAHHRSTPAANLIDRTSLRDAAGNATNHLAEVAAAIDAHRPGALDNPLLAAALRGDYAGKRWQGHLEDMMSPNGFVTEYPVGTEGSMAPRALRVRVRFRFRGEPTVGRGDLPDPSAPPSEDAVAADRTLLALVQKYRSVEQARSLTSSRGINGGLGAATAGDDGSGTISVGSEIGNSTTARTADLRTQIRGGLFAHVQLVQSNYEFVVEVEEAGVPGAATQGVLRRRAERALTPAPPTRRVSAGELGQWVPAGSINPAPPVMPEIEDHRVAILPAAYLVEGLQTYRTGDDPERDQLFDTLFAELGEKQWLNQAGVAQHRTDLERKVSASTRAAAFGDIVSADGFRLTRLPVVGHRNREVGITLRATVSGLRLVSDHGEEKAQLSEADRRQRLAQLTKQSNRFVPTSQGGGYADPASGVGAGLSSGEQVSERDTDISGNRIETMQAQKSEIVSVRLAVQYQLELERYHRTWRGRDKVDLREVIDNAAQGEVVLTMFRHEYDEMRERLDAGKTPLSQADLDRLLDRERALREPPLVKVEAAELVPGQDGWPEYHPYKPLVDALDQARRDQVRVEVTVNQQEGGFRVYTAEPDGTMTGPEEENGFGTAFGRLHPRLAILAEGKVDLRALYQDGHRNGRFTRAVVEALQQEGIPASVLTDFDHVTRSAPRPAAESYQNNPDGAVEHPVRGATGKGGTGVAI